MERLTHKIVYDNEHCQYMFDIDQDSEVGHKLGELEDILESWHIENLEELKIRLHDCQVYHLQNNSNETLIHNLKNELAELQHRLEVAEKALELACNECAFFDYSKTENGKAKQKRFIKQAEKELKGDVGE